MGIKCFKCGHERQPSDVAPDYECPNCSAIYAKVESVLRIKQLSEGESRTTGDDSIEWHGIWLIAIITALYTAVFMLKTGGLPALILGVFVYSPFLLLLKFSLANKEKPSTLRIVFVTMLLNSIGGFFMSYEASIVAKTDAGGALMFAVLPMYQFAISTIGIAVAKKRAK